MPTAEPTEPARPDQVMDDADDMVNKFADRGRRFGRPNCFYQIRTTKILPDSDDQNCQEDEQESDAKAGNQEVEEGAVAQ